LEKEEVLKNSKMRMTVLVLLVMLLAGGCTAENELSEVLNHRIVVESGDTVKFIMQEGRVRFIGKEDGPIEVTGEAAGKFSWQEVDDGVEIIIENKGSGQAGANLEIRIPEDVILDVSSYDADIHLEHINGQMKAVSVAGDVRADELTGNIVLKSGRGDVKAVLCQGYIRVLGEHGVLQMIDLHGNITSGTIMGTVDFTGSIGEGDDVFLETDHGPVLVTITEPVNMQVKAWTASGEVACMIPGLEQTVDGCVGEVGDDVPGKLTVKTVSGKIWMENMP
jgi:DUF4097 and DUF4098 domain-containing protein YvlB